MKRLTLVLVGTILVAIPVFFIRAADPGSGPASQPAAAIQKAGPPEVVFLELLRPIGDESTLKQIVADDRYPNINQVTPGMRIVLQIPMPGHVAGIPQSLRLDSFTDDRNTDLGTGERPKPRYPTGNPPPQVSLTADQSKCLVRIYAASLPAKDATEIRLKGKLTIHVGVGEKTYTQKAFLFRLNKTIEAGPIKLTVSSLSEPGYTPRSARPEGLDVSFQSENSLEMLKKLEFLDAEGKPIAMREQYRVNEPTPSNNGLAGISEYLDKRPHTADVRMTTYEKIEAVDIPLDLKIKVGL